MLIEQLLTVEQLLVVSKTENFIYQLIESSRQ